MSPFALFSTVIAIAALLSFVNYRFVGLPTTIGVMLIALGISLGFILADFAGLPIRGAAANILDRLHFREVLLDGMLAFLLFAGALHVDLGALGDEKLTVGLLATVGVIASTAMVGSLTWMVSHWLSLGLTLGDCFLFGALISPTDPIAVLAVLRSAGVPRNIEVQMAGESLFNDGVGLVVFSVVLGVTSSTTGTGHGTGASVGSLLLHEIGGSLALGLGVGWVVYRMLRSVDNYQVEVFMTLALAMGLYSLASALGSSGPLAVVVAGLLIGNPGRAYAMSERTVAALDSFWELVDEILNVILFVLIGFEVLAVSFHFIVLLAGAIAVVVVLAARVVSVAGTIVILRRFRAFPPHAIKILTWGGLRGGISVALALSLGEGVAGRETILTMTYVVVVFSIAVQGLTIGPFVRRLSAAAT